ncbi:MAG TPA: class I SAM-dependent methyltransferase [Gemmatimonadaceae bacterium]|nr:class I SAM-dependent methyltransferase [Gemmatimonadaceae bacterium]
MRIGLIAARLLGIPQAEDYTERLVRTGEVRRALDVGCGSFSHLTRFRPGITTVGVDAFPDALELARTRGVHDAYVLADVLSADPAELLALAGLGPGERFDLVTLYGLIEHLLRRRGFDLLERCEALTSKYVLLETPNGFVEQGPEFGNVYQRHLSGWFPEDFIGLGYKVYGTTGTKYLRGYAAGPKYPIRGVLTLDVVLSRLLRVDRRARHAFNLVAIKDVRGVPARLGGGGAAA